MSPFIFVTTLAHLLQPVRVDTLGNDEEGVAIFTFIDDTSPVARDLPLALRKLKELVTAVAVHGLELNNGPNGKCFAYRGEDFTTEELDLVEAAGLRPTRCLELLGAWVAGDVAPFVAAHTEDLKRVGRKYALLAAYARWRNTLPSEEKVSVRASEQKLLRLLQWSLAQRTTYIARTVPPTVADALLGLNDRISWELARAIFCDDEDPAVYPGMGEWRDALDEAVDTFDIRGEITTTAQSELARLHLPPDLGGGGVRNSRLTALAAYAASVQLCQSAVLDAARRFTPGLGPVGGDVSLADVVMEYSETWSRLEEAQAACNVPQHQRITRTTAPSEPARCKGLQKRLSRAQYKGLHRRVVAWYEASDPTHRRTAELVSSASPTGRAWLSAYLQLPANALLRDAAIVAFFSRLGRDPPHPPVCSQCSAQVVGPLSTHLPTCKKINNNQTTHKKVKDSIATQLRRHGLLRHTKQEPLLTATAGVRLRAGLTLAVARKRRADLLAEVHGHLCVVDVAVPGAFPDRVHVWDQAKHGYAPVAWTLETALRPGALATEYEYYHKRKEYADWEFTGLTVLHPVVFDRLGGESVGTRRFLDQVRRALPKEERAELRFLREGVSLALLRGKSEGFGKMLRREADPLEGDADDVDDAAAPQGAASPSSLADYKSAASS